MPQRGIESLTEQLNTSETPAEIDSLKRQLAEAYYDLAEIDKAKLLGLYPTVIDQVGVIEAVSLVFQLKGTTTKPVDDEDELKVIEGEVIE